MRLLKRSSLGTKPIENIVVKMSLILPTMAPLSFSGLVQVRLDSFKRRVGAKNQCVVTFRARSFSYLNSFDNYSVICKINLNSFYLDNLLQQLLSRFRGILSGRRSFVILQDKLYILNCHYSSEYFCTASGSQDDVE